jgi:hypothetical protein
LDRRLVLIHNSQIGGDQKFPVVEIASSNVVSLDSSSHTDILIGRLFLEQIDRGKSRKKKG